MPFEQNSRYGIRPILPPACEPEALWREIATAFVGALLQGTLTITIGNGDGTFQAPQDLSLQGLAGLSPSFVVVEDMDNDGDPELVTDAFSSGVMLLQGDGSGDYPVGQPLLLGVGEGPNATVAVELNGDGFLDLAAVNGDSSDVSVLLGDGVTFRWWSRISTVTGSSTSPPLTPACRRSPLMGSRSVSSLGSAGATRCRFSGGGNLIAARGAGEGPCGRPMNSDVDVGQRADLLIATHESAERMEDRCRIYRRPARASL
jgi:hypothetical protein